MSAPIFTSQEYARRLEDAGLTRRQAKTYTSILAELIDEGVMTRQDLRQCEQRLCVSFGAMLAGGVGLLTVLIAFT